MPLPATHLQSVQATVKMANASDLSLRGGQRPTWRPEREARGSALGVQSREGSHVDRTRHCRGADSRARRRTYSPYKAPSKWQTLPICHCEAPEGPWQSRDGSHVDRTRHCRGAACRSRRRTYSPYKPPSKWQTLPICHCEEANGRRGNLGKAVAISPMTSLLSGRVLRDCHVASLLAMTNLIALRHRGNAAHIASLHGAH